MVHFIIAERSKRITVKGDEPEKKDEEDWPLKDVIFVEDVKNFPVGMFHFFYPYPFLGIKLVFDE